jgi:hypothetical protein
MDRFQDPIEPLVGVIAEPVVPRLLPDLTPDETRSFGLKSGIVGKSADPITHILN